MTTMIRPATPDDMPHIARLADSVFRAHRPGHMAEEFPHLYKASNAPHWYVADHDGDIVSILGAQVWDATLSGQPTKVASVGSVATHPDFRRKGLAWRLLTLAETLLRHEGVRLILISGNLALYQRWGARAVGRVAWHRLSSHARDKRFTVRPLDPLRDAPVVARLYETRTTRFHRDLPLLQQLLALQPLTTVEQGLPLGFIAAFGDQPAAYALINHRPFHGRAPSRVIEWAGSPEGLLAIIGHILEEPENSIEVPVLENELSLAMLLAHVPAARQGPYAWLVKVIDGHGLVSDLRTVWQERSSGPLTVQRKSFNSYAIHFAEESWVTDGPTLTEWLFRPDATTRPQSLSAVWPIMPLWPEGLNYI
ncbi:MAG: GNAT family N-acetyltransferase [Firmicutes bacterium]|nr:GNAT family N-acetyltransferase [Bacillota bacterium]